MGDKEGDSSQEGGGGFLGRKPSCRPVSSREGVKGQVVEAPVTGPGENAAGPMEEGTRD